MKPVKSNINERISLTLNGKLVIFFADDLTIMKGDNRATKFYIGETEEYHSSYHLGDYDALIDKCGLKQVHRSYFINFNKIKEYNIADETILMTNNILVPLAKSFKSKFLKLFKNFRNKK